jgi:hypothetical protein
MTDEGLRLACWGFWRRWLKNFVGVVRVFVGFWGIGSIWLGFNYSFEGMIK